MHSSDLGDVDGLNNGHIKDYKAQMDLYLINSRYSNNKNAGLYKKLYNY